MDEEKLLAATAEPLLAWYDENKRRLPWRQTRDPYRIWVSEIMLQQTRVAAVLPYYERWMAALPDTAALARTESETLMKLWQGLGYYSRARNLQKAAQIIVDQRSGRFPDTYEDLLSLPGVGDYTAGAVASIAFGRQVPAVDGNVLRVAARVSGIGENILEPGVKARFRQLMAGAVPAGRPGEYNQALMDLGALICLPKGQADCPGCPLSPLCRARALGLQGQLPVREKKGVRRQEELTVYLLVQNGRVAVRKRPDTGLLAGLWEFPHTPGALEEGAAAEAVARWGLTALDWRKKLAAKHIFTHIRWDMTGYLLTVRGQGEGLTWVDAAGLETLAIPSAFGKFLREAASALAAESEGAAV